MRWSEPSLQKAKVMLAPVAWRVLAGLVRVRAEEVDRTAVGGAVIYACLHRDIIPALLHVRSHRPHLLISQSADGDILIRTLEPDGFGFVRGSTGNRGVRAFARMLSVLRDGRSVGIAVDGPKGPFGEIREGVIQLARRSGRPVVPLLVEPGRHRVLGTWDRTILPLPLSTVTVRESGPLVVPADADAEQVESCRRRLADILLTPSAREGTGARFPLREADEGGQP